MDQNGIFDLNEYKFAKRIVDDYPKLMVEMSTIRDTLWPYRHYTSVLYVIDSVEVELINMHKTFKHYEEIVKRRGEK